MEKQFIEEVFKIIYGDIVYKNKSYDDALEKLRTIKYGDQLYEDILNFLRENKFNLFSLPTQKQIEEQKRGSSLLKKIKANGGMTRTIRNYHLYLDRKYEFSKCFNQQETQEEN
tara:strand:+ start:1237 stop:1578 length:342 start_codon:yes stop_codon:yes gene_type:complete